MVSHRQWPIHPHLLRRRPVHRAATPRRRRPSSWTRRAAHLGRRGRRDARRANHGRLHLCWGVLRGESGGFGANVARRPERGISPKPQKFLNPKSCPGADSTPPGGAGQGYIVRRGADRGQRTTVAASACGGAQTAKAAAGDKWWAVLRGPSCRVGHLPPGSLARKHGAHMGTMARQVADCPWATTVLHLANTPRAN
jgi:hypothetical protein